MAANIELTTKNASLLLFALGLFFELFNQFSL